MEQRYQAVLEVLAGAPVVDVAERFGVSRQAVHRWVNWYRAEGVEGLADRSKRPKSSPWQVPAQVEALVCEMRRAHPRWGPRRIRADLAKAGVEVVPHRSSIYRILIRFDLVAVKPRRKKRSDYKRWQRDAPMELWQMDIVGSCFLTSGKEVKVVTGVDDHSRYCVIAAVVPQASGRAVCAAFVQALARYGCPDQVLTDNGKQFTGRFSRPRPAEVMFEKICRRNGITTILTKPRSPTTTGKVERFHQTLQGDCLTALGPFPSVQAAQAAVDAFVVQYNQDRPHQALDDAVPASKFVPRPLPGEAGLGLEVPAELLTTAPGSLTAAQPQPWPETPSGPQAAGVAGLAASGLREPAVAAGQHDQGFLTDAEHWLGGDAIEVDRVVPASGNITIGGQQFWIGPVHAGEPMRVWLDTTTAHLSVAGRHRRTVPSRQTPVTLARLRAEGARPAGPPPNRAVPVPGLAAGMVVEVERVVSSGGTIGLAGRVVVVGQALAGQKITLRLLDQVAHIITLDGELTRTIPTPVPPEHRGKLWGARLVDPTADQPVVQPVRVQRKVSSGGTTRVTGQVLRLGEAHRHTIVDITVHDRELHVADLNGQTLAVIARTTTAQVRNFKASGWSGKIHNHPQE